MTRDQLQLHIHHLEYVPRLEPRDTADIDLVVIHSTELPDMETAREFGERVLYAGSQSGNSGHYYVDKDGRVEQWVPPERIAHHTAGYNPRSIGIELINRGRYPDWFDSRRQTPSDPYPAAQMEALIQLLRRLSLEYPGLRYIAGHEDLDTAGIPAEDDPATMIRRKIDPGPLFSWPTVEAEVSLQRIRTSEELDS